MRYGTCTEAVYSCLILTERRFGEVERRVFAVGEWQRQWHLEKNQGKWLIYIVVTYFAYCCIIKP